MAATIVGGAPTPASAQRYWSPDQVPYCPQTQSQEDCRSDSLALLLDKLELPGAESLAADGYKGVRVFQYDAFGVIWPATIFLTRPVNQYEREGVALARIIHADGRLATLQRPAWENGWQDIDGVVRTLMALPPQAPEPVWVPGSGVPPPPTCLDPPVVIVEVIDQGQVRRLWRRVCAEDPDRAPASRVAEVIAAAFPVCGHLPVERYGMGLGRLRACLLLEGDDPLSALAVMAIPQPDVNGHTRVAYESGHQSDRVRLLGVDGRRASGRAQVDAALLSGALGPRYLRLLRATGDVDGVTVSGLLWLADRPNAPDPLPVSLRWMKEADGVWRITEWSVEQR